MPVLRVVLILLLLDDLSLSIVASLDSVLDNDCPHQSFIDAFLDKVRLVRIMFHAERDNIVHFLRLPVSEGTIDVWNAARVW